MVSVGTWLKRYCERYISSMHLDDKLHRLTLYAEVQGAMFVTREIGHVG
jgi:hypothetical protein